MPDHDLNSLLERLQALERESEGLRRELARLRAEVERTVAERPGGPPPSRGPAPGATEAGEPSGRKAPGTEARASERAADAGARERTEPRSPVSSTGVPDTSGRLVRRAADLEFWLGARGLLLLGVLAGVLAVGFFLKLAIEQGWIEPTIRVLLGAAAGIAAVVLGERIRARGYRTYGLWLSAGGFSAVYLSLWAAAELYALVPVSAGFILMIGVVAAAAALGLVRESQGFVTLAAFGGYLAPVLVGVDPTSALFGLGYLAILTGAGLWEAHRAEWRWLAATVVAGGTLMALAGRELPYLHGSYLIVLVGAALVVARDRRWPGIGVAAVLLGWLVLAVGAGGWDIRELGLSAAAAGLWVANLLGSVGLRDWAAAGVRERLDQAPELELLKERRAVFLDDLAGFVVTLLPPWLFFVYAMVGIDASAYSDQQDTIGLILGLTVGSVYLLLASYGPPGHGIAARRWKAGLGYAFWLVAPMLQWGDAALMRIWILEGLAFTAAGVLVRSVVGRVAGLSALGLAVWMYLLLSLDAVGFGRAFVGIWALSRLAVPVALSIWALGVDRAAGARSWELNLRLPTLAVAGLLFLQWGTMEIQRYFGALGADASLALQRDLSISGFWLGYAAVLLALGFFLGRARVRWAGLAMALVTAGKVFFYDLAYLSEFYRIVSFLLLAVVLLALSYGYQKMRDRPSDGGA